MASKCLGVNGPGGPLEKIVMIVLSKNTIVGYVPLEVGSYLEIHPVLGLHAEAAPTILENLLMKRPSDVGKINVSSKELNTTEEAVERIQRPEDIPPKPSDIVANN